MRNLGSDKRTSLVDINPIVANGMSGVGFFVHRLFSAQTKDEREVDISGYYFDFLKHDITLDVDMNTRPIRHLPGKVVGLCRRLGFQPPIDIFTGTNYRSLIFTNYIALPSIKKVPVCVFIYDMVFLDHPEYVEEKNLRNLQRFCGKSIMKADLIVTISEFTKQRINFHFPNHTAKIIVIPIPPSNKGVTANIPSALSDTTKPFILFVGTIEPRKNIANLIKAYDLLPLRIKKAYNLVLAGGKGWKNTEIELTIKRVRKNGGSIIETGYVSEAEKTWLYSNASILTMPSIYEGFGMPILEAMTYDLPVICSDIDVFREVAHDAPSYIRPDIPSDITNAIEKIISDSKYSREMVKRGRTVLSSYPSWVDNARSLERSLTEGGF